MSEAAKHTHHGFDYVEITVADLGASKRFYGEAFGWSFVDYGPEYAGIHCDGREQGGLCTGAATGARGGPLVVLYSADLDDTVAKVRAARGVIVKEPFAFPGGRRFHFVDPSGNELAVWSS